jgi:hypothetical protein
MAPIHSLEGLMKWSEREEWQDAFLRALDAHVLPACDQMDMDPNEVVATLGENLFMSSLWACAFEDFVTRELGDGRNVVDDYLKRRGWKESAATRAYLAALRKSVPSLYEVSNIVLDQSFRARDLVRGGEPVLISERLATRSLKPWDRIATRVLQLGSESVISGAVLGFNPPAASQLLKELQRAADPGTSAKGRRRASRDQPSNDAPISDDELRRAAPTISTIWLIDTVVRARSPMPQMTNTDGDEILFCRMHYPFVRQSAVKEIRSALDDCSQLDEAGPSFWNWMEHRPPPKSSAKTKRAGAGTLATTSSRESLVLGNVQLRADALVVSVNSRARCDRARSFVTEVLGGLVGRPLVEMETIERSMAHASRPAPKEPDLPAEERSRIVHEALDRHYRDILDQAVPALGNKSPRAAVKSAKGRADVIEWLKGMENQTAKYSGSDQDMATYDFGWLWTELGLKDLRR